MEAFSWYEKGLFLAQNIQSWDYIYGSIWRELALAKFNDSSCLKRLIDFAEESKRQKFSYLLSLASCFYILASMNLEQYKCEQIKKYYDIVKEINLPGHILQAEIAIQLMQRNNLLSEEFNSRKVANEIISECIQKCQGVKGMPEIIYEYVENGNIELTVNERKWYTKYIISIIKYKRLYKKNLFERRTDDEFPYLKAMNCVNCEAKCCYDGVYLRTESEQKNIEKLIEMYPEEFINIPKDYIVYGTWPGMERMKKIAIKPHEYKCTDFPTHFNKTICVFAMENGECLLQRVATDHQLHPWFAKPTACWLFPIRGFIQNEGKMIAPLDKTEKDPDYIDEEYPGYASFLPCGNALGDNYIDKFEIKDYISWRELFANEIEYYDFLVSEKQL